MRGSSIRDYVLELIERDQASPPYEEWIEAVRQLGPIDLPESPAETLRAIRDELEEDLDRKLRR